MTTGEIGLLVFTGAWLVAAGLWWAWRAWHPAGPPRESVRRAAGNALFLMEEFVAPRVEHVLTARQVRNEDDREAGGDDSDPITLATRVKSDLGTSLARQPIDLEEIRGLLESADRGGLDWQSLFSETVRAEVAARPYRAPSLPPAWRVTPRSANLAVGDDAAHT